MAGPESPSESLSASVSESLSESLSPSVPGGVYAEPSLDDPVQAAAAKIDKISKINRWFFINTLLGLYLFAHFNVDFSIKKSSMAT
jgi:hypothetical protein